MIERKVAFVFGAGASADFGMPLGRGLVRGILQHLSAPARQQEIAIHAQKMPELQGRIPGELIQDLEAIRVGLSDHPPSSIDDWFLPP